MVEGSGVKVEMPDEAESSVTLRVLLVEDDPFQQMALSGIIARVEAENAQLTVQLKIAGTGDEALAALEAVESHLVLLDYKLPGGDADTLLPGIRERVGPLASYGGCTVAKLKFMGTKKPGVARLFLTTRSLNQKFHWNSTPAVR